MIYGIIEVIIGHDYMKLMDWHLKMLLWEQMVLDIYLLARLLIYQLVLRHKIDIDDSFNVCDTM